MMHWVRLLLCCRLAVSPMVASLLALTAVPSGLAVEAPRRLVVMPLRLLGMDASNAWLGESFAEYLTLALSQSNQLMLVERAQIDRILQEQGFGQSAFVDEGSAPALGRLLGAQQIILGSLQRQGDQLIVSLRLVDTSTGQLVPGSAILLQGKQDKLLLLQQQVAMQLLQKSTGATSDNVRKLVEGLTISASSQAYELYHRSLTLIRNLSDANLQLAIQQLQEATRLDPGFTLAYAALSEAYSTRAGFKDFLASARPDDFETAMVYAKKALSFGNNLAAVYRALARAQFASGNRPEALKAIKAALAEKPGDPLSIQAWLDYRAKEGSSLQQLRQELRELGASPDDPDLQMVLAQVQIDELKHQQHPDPQAVKELLLNLKANPVQNPYLRIKIAELEILDGRPADAMRTTEQALSQEPENYMLHFSAATIFFKLTEYQDFVESHFKKASELNPAFGFARSFLGMFYLSHDQLGLARSELLEAQRLQPDSAFAPMMLGQVALSDNNLTQAYAYFLRGLANLGKIPGETVSRGDILLTLIKIGTVLKRPETETHIQALFAGGVGVESRHCRALVLFLITHQNFDRAEQGFREYTQAPGYVLSPEDERLYQKMYLTRQMLAHPEDVSFLNDLGSLALLEENWEEAETLLNRAIGLDAKQPAVLFNLGLLRMHQQRFAEAGICFEQVLAKQPSHTKARLSLGEAMLKLGNKLQARKIWEDLLRDEPGNQDALKALEQISP